jgi:hypothetical protein
MTAVTTERLGDPDTASAALWYFAYGASMSPNALESMNVHPTRAVPASLDLYLNFEALMIPYLDPCFPSVGEKPILPDQPRCHGVAFEVTPEEFRYICLKQAGNGHPGLGYQVTDRKCTAYDGQELECKVLRLVGPAHVDVQPFPSRRYMSKLEAGAKAHGVHEGYQRWIRSLPRYVGAQSMREKIGKVLFLAIFMPPQAALVLLSQIWRPEQSPRFISAFLDLLRTPSWWCYRRIFCPIFGPGAGEQHA